MLMSLICALCGYEAFWPRKLDGIPWRRRAAKEGWTADLVMGNLIWRCPRCQPRKETEDFP